MSYGLFMCFYSQKQNKKGCDCVQWADDTVSDQSHLNSIKNKMVSWESLISANIILLPRRIDTSPVHDETGEDNNSHNPTLQGFCFHCSD